MGRDFERPLGDAGSGQLIALAGYLSANEAVKAARRITGTLEH